MLLHGLRGLVLTAALLIPAASGASEGNPGPVAGHGAPVEPGTNTARRLEIPGLENVHDLGHGLLCGGQPRGGSGFDSLAAQGVRTVVSVDGMEPDLERARRHGMRYVHVPIGYDGVGTNALRRLAKAVSTLPGPFYIHCHQGRHRGPAAAAAVARTLHRWTAAQASAWLTVAGTDPRYVGLHRDATNAPPIPPDEIALIADPLPETTPVEPLVRAMVAVDHELEALRSQRGDAFGPASEAVAAAAMATRLSELFRESARLDGSGPAGGELRSGLTEAADQASHLADQLAGVRDPAAAENTFRKFTEGCARCHRRHRDPPANP
jgi:protein tyrosine phosphatase (PTP) superfamily phosphohydrolase (DUF442 family)